MNFDGNFIDRGAVDVTELRAKILGEAEDTWRADSFRQRTFDVHRDTETIFLIFDQDPMRLTATRLPRFADYEPLVAPIFDRLSASLCGEGWCLRCIFTRLRPGGTIPAHVDGGFALERAHRVHIPIVTGARVQFRVGEETKNLDAGRMWEINNLRPHAVENGGDGSRVHLIVDWICPASLMNPA